MEGVLPPTVGINNEWWGPTQRQVLTEEAVGTALLTLGAKEMALSNDMSAEEQKSLTTVTLDPLKLISPLLKSPFLAPPAVYAFIKSRALAAQLTIEVQPLLQWLKG